RVRRPGPGTSNPLDGERPGRFLRPGRDDGRNYRALRPLAAVFSGWIAPGRRSLARRQARRRLESTLIAGRGVLDPLIRGTGAARRFQKLEPRLRGGTGFLRRARKLPVKVESGVELGRGASPGNP